MLEIEKEELDRPCEELSLEVAMDLSSDRLRKERTLMHAVNRANFAL
jgi:hypothetical protein